MKSNKFDIKTSKTNNVSAFRIIISVLLLVVFACCGNLIVFLVKENNNIESIKKYLFLQTRELPIIRIDTENKKQITSKEDYVACKVSLNNSNENFTNVLAKIKGRGNSTWGMPKKPYKLKFDSKINLFENGKAKEWTLIANYADPSLLRNYLAYTVGSAMDDLEFTTSTQFVELFVNHDFSGLYLLCEQIEVKENRVEIDDDLSSTNTGYLFEMDARAKDEGVEGIDYFVSNGKYFVIKSPDTEDDLYTTEFTTFAKNYMDNCIESLQSNDFEDVKTNFDIESFADAYIVNELFKPVDIGFSSFYMFKRKDDAKLYCGPIWDYDLSSGNSSVEKSNDTDYLYAKNTNMFFEGLLEYDGFCELVESKLQKYETSIINLIDSSINYVLNNYNNSFEVNFLRWDCLHKKMDLSSNEVANLTSWRENVQFLQNWLHDSWENLVDYYVE